MKLLIASDIHGSAYYCGKLLEVFEEEKADRLLLLGDILYHGPRNDLPRDYSPRKVVEMLRDYRKKTICVRGNCDADIDLAVLPFPMSSDCALLPIGGRMAYATHGHVYNSENIPPLGQGDILLYGHTHIPALKEAGGVMCVNPGSVSLPKSGSRHSCILLRDGIFGWKDIETGGYFRHFDSCADDKPM